MCLLIACFIVCVTGKQQAAFASPYSAVYDHGCDYAKVSDSSDKLYQSQGKGPNIEKTISKIASRN
jgi:hypothetical protein